MNTVQSFILKSRVRSKNVGLPAIYRTGACLFFIFCGGQAITVLVINIDCGKIVMKVSFAFLVLASKHVLILKYCGLGYSLIRLGACTIKLLQP
jgi:hypothetical protein